MIVIKYSDPEYKTKKEELEKLGYKVRAWLPDGLGYVLESNEKSLDKNSLPQ